MRDRKFSWNLMENKSLVRKIHLKTFACGIISEDITSGRSPSDIILMLSSMSIFFFHCSTLPVTILANNIVNSLVVNMAKKDSCICTFLFYCC